MKKIILLFVFTAFLSCETTTEAKYAGMFTGGQNSYDLQQGSIEYASIIKNVVLGYADGNFEEIIELGCAERLDVTTFSTNVLGNY